MLTSARFKLGSEFNYYKEAVEDLNLFGHRHYLGEGFQKKMVEPFVERTNQEKPGFNIGVLLANKSREGDVGY
jgi:hypothetical protein